MKIKLFICTLLLTFSVFGQKVSYSVSAALAQQAAFTKLPTKKIITIAYLPPATEYNFYLKLGEKIQQHAKTHKFNFVLKAPQSGTDWQKHVQMIKTMVENKVEVIIYSSFLPQTEAAIAPYIQQAVSQGTIVINVNSDELNLAYPVHAIIGGNQRKSTKLLAQHAVTKLNIEAGQAAIITGEHGQFSTERVGGIIDGLENSGLNIVASINGHWNAEGGYHSAIKLLQQYPNIKAIFAANDFEIIGAMAATEQMGKPDILLFGYDGVPDALELIAEDKIAGTSLVDAEGLGELTFKVLLDILAGNFNGGFVEAQTQMVTKANVTRFLNDQQKISLDLKVDNIVLVTEVIKNSQNDDINGLFLDIFKAIYQPVGITVELNAMPYIRAEHMVRNNQADVMIGNYRGNTNGMHFPQWHYAVQEIVALFNMQQLTWQGVKSLSDKKVSWIRGYGFESYIPANIKMVNQTYRSQGLNMLNKGRIDVYIDEKSAIIRANQKLQPESLDFEKYQFANIANLKLYPAFSTTAKGLKLARIFDQRMPMLLSSGKLEQLYKKWGYTSFLSSFTQ